MQVRADGGETELTKYTHEGVQHEVGARLLPDYNTLHSHGWLVNAQGAPRAHPAGIRRLLQHIAISPLQACLRVCSSPSGANAATSTCLPLALTGMSHRVTHTAICTSQHARIHRGLQVELGLGDLRRAYAELHEQLDLGPERRPPEEQQQIKQHVSPCLLLMSVTVQAQQHAEAALQQHILCMWARGCAQSH